MSPGLLICCPRLSKPERSQPVLLICAREIHCRSDLSNVYVTAVTKSTFEGRYGSSQSALHHWREAVPDDRLAHLVKDAMRGMSRALQVRLAEHSVLLGHWTFLRILWECDGLTQSQLSEEAGVMGATTHSAMDAMEKMGFIMRKKLPTNRKN